MDFEIAGVEDYRIVFFEREFDKKEWLTHYKVTIQAPDMNGTVRVENPPAGRSPLHLFQSIQKEWRGWKGEKGWGALEGEFDLSASSDKTGHITLKARLFSGYSPPSSKLEIELIVESGQTDSIAKKAQEFFQY